MKPSDFDCMECSFGLIIAPFHIWFWRILLKNKCL